MELQEAFQLMLPNPTVFFVVFSLQCDLDGCFLLEYQSPYLQRSQPYQSSLTLMETILQSLATIATRSTYIYKGRGRGDVEFKSKVLFVGTHKDQVTQSEINKIDKSIQNAIKSTSYSSNDMVQFASESQLIFPVSNLDEDDSDFCAIRSRVNAIAKLGEYRMSIPTQWYVFSLFVHRLTGHVISYAECHKLAQECGIDSDEELRDALWFLHTKLGVIRYFPYGDVSTIVIIDPQFLFDKLTELFVNAIMFDRGTRLSETLTKKEIFSFYDFSRIDMTESPLLTHSRFIEILKQLHIAVPLPGGEKFLIPCFWTHAIQAVIPPKQHSLVPTLVITFDCGYFPRGVTCAVIDCLMKNEMQSKFTWKLQPDQVRCNQVTFLIGPSLNITVSFYPTRFEVVAAPSAEEPIQDICRDVCQSIQKAIQTVSTNMRLTFHCAPSFYCTGCCNLHIAELVLHKGIPCQLWCKRQQQFFDLPSGFHFWFEAPLQKKVKPPEPTTGNTSCTPNLPQAYKFIFPLHSNWKRLGLSLCIHPEELDRIQQEHVETSDCFLEMLSMWLKTADPFPSWQTLADALDDLNCHTVAEKIRKTYYTS